jgi:hypothetical protein
LRSFYSEGEVVELIAAVGLFNFNRFNGSVKDGSHAARKPEELALAGVETPAAV